MPNEPSSLSLVTESRGRRADEALLFVGEQMREREEKIIASVMSALEKDQMLDERYAVQQWIALSEVKRFHKKLSTISTKGQNAARRNASMHPDIA